MTKFDSIYQEQLLELPDLERSAVQSIEWQRLIIEIGKRYGLHLEELEELRTETMLVLVGITDSGSYYDHLISQLAVSPSVAEKIVTDVNNQILAPIQAFIMRGGPVGSPASLSEGAAFQARVVPNLDTTLKTAGIELVEEVPESNPLTAHISPGTLASTGIIPSREDEKAGFEPLSEKTSTIPTPTPTSNPAPLSGGEVHPHTPLADEITKLLAEKKLSEARVTTPQPHDVLI